MRLSWEAVINWGPCPHCKARRTQPCLSGVKLEVATGRRFRSPLAIVHGARRKAAEKAAEKAWWIKLAEARLTALEPVAKAKDAELEHVRQIARQFGYHPD